MAHIVGFKITIIDDRPEFANPGRFPEAEQTIVSDMTSAFEQLTVDHSSYIVIITHGHQCDEAALAGVLKRRYTIFSFGKSCGKEFSNGAEFNQKAEYRD